MGQHHPVGAAIAIEVVVVDGAVNAPVGVHVHGQTVTVAIERGGLGG